jgi:hypothetical protein
MKKRQYIRMSSGSYRRSPATISYLTALGFLGAYLTYVLLQIFYFQRTNGYILEFILMGVISASCVALIPRLPWVLKCIFMEGYIFVYLFFIMDMYDNPLSYLPMGLTFGILFLLTLIGYVLAPYLLRFHIEFIGSVEPKVSKGWR